MNQTPITIPSQIGIDKQEKLIPHQSLDNQFEQLYLELGNLYEFSCRFEGIVNKMLGEHSVEKFEFTPIDIEYESVHGKMTNVINRLYELNKKLQHLNKHLLVYV